MNLCVHLTRINVSEFGFSSFFYVKPFFISKLWFICYLVIQFQFGFECKNENFDNITDKIETKTLNSWKLNSRQLKTYSIRLMSIDKKKTTHKFYSKTESANFTKKLFSITNQLLSHFILWAFLLLIFFFMFDCF